MDASRPSGIPLRPDPRAREREALATFMRACVATAMGVLDKTVRPGDYAARTWPQDRDVGLVLRAPVSPASTDSAAALLQVSLALLSALRPLSAAADLLGRAI